MPDASPVRPEWFRWVQAVAEGGMIGAVAVWWWHALWTLLAAVWFCVAVAWEAAPIVWHLAAAIWRMSPWPPV